MAREVWRGYLVEGKTTFGEYPALWKGDFLDFHASPFALAIATRALANASQFTSPSCVADWSSSSWLICKSFSSAESKSGAAEIRCALARFPLWRAQISVLPYLIMPHVESCFQGPGVWSVLFISCVRFGCCGGKIGVEGKIIGNDQSSINARRCEKVWRVRKGKESENAGRLEQRRERLGLSPHSVEGIILRSLLSLVRNEGRNERKESGPLLLCKSCFALSNIHIAKLYG